MKVVMLHESAQTQTSYPNAALSTLPQVYMSMFELTCSVQSVDGDDSTSSKKNSPQ